MSTRLLLLSILGVLSLILTNYQKENLTPSIGSTETIRALPPQIEPYQEGVFSDIEEIRNQIAEALGSAISKDKVFKKELFGVTIQGVLDANNINLIRRKHYLKLVD
jgi:hypothetical protein